MIDDIQVNFFLFFSQTEGKEAFYALFDAYAAQVSDDNTIMVRTRGMHFIIKLLGRNDKMKHTSEEHGNTLHLSAKY